MNLKTVRILAVMAVILDLVGASLAGSEASATPSATPSLTETFNPTLTPALTETAIAATQDDR